MVTAVLDEPTSALDLAGYVTPGLGPGGVRVGIERTGALPGGNEWNSNDGTRSVARPQTARRVPGRRGGGGMVGGGVR